MLELGLFTLEDVVGFGGIAEDELDDVLGPALELETDDWEDVVGFGGGWEEEEELLDPTLELEA